MPFYPAKPFEIPHDDWFNNNSSNLENKSETKGTRNITTIHDFFYRQSDLKIGGSENHIQTNLEKKSSSNIINLFFQNSKESLIFSSREKYSYSKIPTKLKSIKKRSFQAKKIDKNLSYKNAFNLKSYLLDLKSLFIKIINKNT